ncbi:MAG: phosphoglycerate dehydrogenase [Chloroflexi bacterium]|nr:phosphoglycerate dehydrogenase [Chloroflexota bacterium]
MSRVLISSQLVSEAEDADALTALRADGHELTFNQALVGKSEDDVIAAIADFDGIVASTEPYTRRVLESNRRLRVLSRTGVGYDAVDVEAATELGIAICTTVGSNDRTVADWAVLAMLSLARKLPEAVAGMADGGWQRAVGIDFWDKTVGIVGLGAIGKHVARRVRGFEAEVLGFDVVRDDQFAAQVGMTYVELDELLERADFVTIHAPLLAATRGLINEDRLRRMKPTAYLVNTSRGPVVDERAIERALREGWIAGAALDVFEIEPLAADSPLRKLPNVMLSAHVAGITYESTRRSATMACESLRRVLKGEPPLAIVNPDALRR